MKPVGGIKKNNAFSFGSLSVEGKDMEIIDLFRSYASFIKARFAVKMIGLFGSYA